MDINKECELLCSKVVDYERESSQWGDSSRKLGEFRHQKSNLDNTSDNSKNMQTQLIEDYNFFSEKRDFNKTSIMQPDKDSNPFFANSSDRHLGEEENKTRRYD